MSPIGQYIKDRTEILKDNATRRLEVFRRSVRDLLVEELSQAATKFVKEHAKHNVHLVFSTYHDLGWQYITHDRRLVSLDDPTESALQDLPGAAELAYLGDLVIIYVDRHDLKGVTLAFQSPEADS